MQEIDNWFDALVFSAQDVLFQVVRFLPKLLAVILLLVIAWLIAKLLEKVTNKLFVLIGIDKISEKAGIGSFLVSSGFPGNLSYVFAKMVFWTIIVLFILPITNILGLKFFANIVDDILGYLPNLFVAILILLVGAWGAKVISAIVKGSANKIGLENADLIGSITNFFILILTFIIALTQLKIETDILTNVLMIFMASMGLAVAISFGLGSKDIFRNIIAGVYLNKSIREGEKIKTSHVNGKIIHIGTILTKIETSDNEELSVPNSQLVESTIN